VVVVLCGLSWTSAVLCAGEFEEREEEEESVEKCTNFVVSRFWSQPNFVIATLLLLQTLRASTSAW
jgi:hypothetical protein